jgi:hypothetical protein
VAAVEAHAVVERILALGLLLITGVGDPAVRLQKNGGAEVLLLVPPIRWARCGAARAKNAFVESVQLLAVGLGLAVFTALWMQLGQAPFYSTTQKRYTHVRGGGITLEIRLDGAILLVEKGHVRNKILNDVHVREGVDAGFLSGIGRDTACDTLVPSPLFPSRKFTYKDRPRC